LKPIAIAHESSASLLIKFVRVCHHYSLSFAFFGFFLLIGGLSPSLYSQQPSVKLPAGTPAPGSQEFASQKQESRGEWTYLRGACKITTHEMVVFADQIDYNAITHIAWLRGHVHYQNYLKGDKLEADHGDYNLQTQDGHFYQVKGTTPAKVIAEALLMTTTNPFYFEGESADRFHDRYIIHHGFITDCKLPKPWWRLRAPMFDVLPDDHAVAHMAVFQVKSVPLFLFPYFYHPLGKKTRHSGFLTPSIGHSNLLGYMYGDGYYWAINRSYDATYRIEDYTARGYAHYFDFRGDPTQKTSFDFNLFGVQDRGLQIGTAPPIKEGGLQFELTAKTELPGGFQGALDYRYLSSFLFRQSFTQTFYEAIFSEINSVGFLQKRWTDYTFNIAFERQELYESVLLNDSVVIQKLPSFDFVGKDQKVNVGSLPVWFSFDSNTSLLRRQEPTYQTGNAVDREDFEPRVMTAFSFAGFELVPSITLHATHYGDSLAAPAQLANASLFRKAGEVNVDLIPPPLERIFPAPKWLGQKLKHVVEPRISYRYINGVDNLNNVLRFDETDILSDTNQLELSITNRLYLKNKKGKVIELANWQLLQDRYFDPTFGGAVINGQRNVFTATEDLTPFAFIDRPRTDSPVVSVFRVNPNGIIGVDWRANYDPLWHKIVVNAITTDIRPKPNYFLSLGYRELNPDPSIEPFSSQLSVTAGYGGLYRHGWNIAGSAYYDYNRDQLEYLTGQVSYNTDCCGFTVQVKRFSFGIRNENQFLLSIAIANIGAFGNLRRQDRIF
jgi:LPS-assembly protein